MDYDAEWKSDRCKEHKELEKIRLMCACGKQIKSGVRDERRKDSGDPAEHLQWRRTADPEGRWR